MRAVLLPGGRKVDIVDRPTPEPGPGEEAGEFAPAHAWVGGGHLEGLVNPHRQRV